MALQRRLNERIDGSFGRKNDYDFAQVLALHWAETDQDFESEAYKIKYFFKSDLGYDVSHFAIPEANSTLELTQAIDHFLHQEKSPRTLHIIHYGGHGDEDNNSAYDRRKQCVFAS